MPTNSPAQNSAAVASQLRDIKPPIAIQDPWIYVLWAAVLLCLAALAFALWKWRRSRRAQVPVIPTVPAHVRAKQKLEEALALISQPKPFCILVSDTIRLYLEERFSFRAPERTTEEFLHELRRTELLLPDQKESLGEFLSRCDLVKFAKYEPREAELRDLHESACRLVEETLPIEGPPPVPSETGSHQASLATPGPVGKILAIAGAVSYAIPFVWVASIVVTLIRVLIQSDGPGASPAPTTNAPPPNLLRTFQTEMLLTFLCVGAVVIGLVFLTLALVKFRYRAGWFFWFLIVFGILSLGIFPIGTAFGVFVLIYCLTRRAEFRAPQPCKPMTFAHPWLLLLLLLLPLLAWLKGRRGQPPAFVYSSLQLVRAVLNVSRSRSGAFLASLRWLALVLLIIALAQPRFSQSRTAISASGIDIAVALDLSGSMASEDFEVGNGRLNRLDMARSVLKKFIDKRPSDRIGLVAFAAQAYLAAPLTLDHDFLLQHLDRLDLETIDGTRTAIGSGLSTAINGCAN
jgi:N-terminal double-transmembrane domain